LRKEPLADAAAYQRLGVRLTEILAGPVSLVQFTYPRNLLIEFGELAATSWNQLVGDTTLSTICSWEVTRGTESSWFDAHTGDEEVALAWLQPIVGRRVDALRVEAPMLDLYLQFGDVELCILGGDEEVDEVDDDLDSGWYAAIRHRERIAIDVGPDQAFRTFEPSDTDWDLYELD
jgi:hypothetical protein